MPDSMNRLSLLRKITIVEIQSTAEILILHVTLDMS